MIIKISWREYPDSSKNDIDEYDAIVENKCIDHISTLKGFKRHRQYHTQKEYFDGFRIVNLIFEFEDGTGFLSTKDAIQKEIDVQVI